MSNKRTYIGTNGEPPVYDYTVTGLQVRLQPSVSSGGKNGYNTIFYKKYLQLESINKNILPKPIYTTVPNITLNSVLTSPVLVDINAGPGDTWFSVNPSDYKSNTVFTSEDTSILTVDSSTGAITPVSAGTTRLIVECEDRKLEIPIKVVNTTYTSITGFHCPPGYRYGFKEIFTNEYDTFRNRYTSSIVSFASTDWAGTTLEWKALSEEEKDVYRNATSLIMEPDTLYRFTLPNIPSTLTSLLPDGVQLEFFNTETEKKQNFDFLNFYGGDYSAGKNTGYCWCGRTPADEASKVIINLAEPSGSYTPKNNFNETVCEWIQNNLVIEKIEVSE